MKRILETVRQREEKHFNLPRFFNIFSMGIIIIFSIVLSAIFLMQQKRLIVDHAIEMAESYAHLLNHEIAERYQFRFAQQGHFMTIEQDSIRVNELDDIVHTSINRYKSIFKVKIYNRQGVVVYSTDHTNIGQKTDSENFANALNNRISSELTQKKNPVRDSTEEGKIYEADIMEVYIPIMNNIKHDFRDDHSYESTLITGVFEIYQDVTDMFDMVETASYKISIYVFLAMAGLFFFLHIIVKKADGIISKKNMEIDTQNRELEEAQRQIKGSIDDVIQHGSFNIRYTSNRLLKCWEFKKCKENECPSYHSGDLRCWQVAGTYCGGRVQGVFAQKYGDCRRCEVYQHAFNDKFNIIGESFNNMMSLLESKHTELEQLNEKLNRLVDIDPLTETRNRRSFHQHMENIHLMALRYHHPYSIIICDVDNFKLYNDTYGHQRGDYVLVTIVNTIKATVRKTDGIFRWGGEEFVIILPEQNIVTALKVAENLRAAVELLKIEHKNNVHPSVTISCGVCSNSAGHISWSDVLKSADKALYKAKMAGRNCVCAAPDTDYKT